MAAAAGRAHPRGWAVADEVLPPPARALGEVRRVSYADLLAAPAASAWLPRGASVVIGVTAAGKQPLVVRE